MCVWCGVVWCGVVWCGVVWCGVRACVRACVCLVWFGHPHTSRIKASVIVSLDRAVICGKHCGSVQRQYCHLIGYRGSVVWSCIASRKPILQVLLSDHGNHCNETLATAVFLDEAVTFQEVSSCIHSKTALVTVLLSLELYTCGSFILPCGHCEGTLVLPLFGPAITLERHRSCCV